MPFTTPDNLIRYPDIFTSVITGLWIVAGQKSPLVIRIISREVHKKTGCWMPKSTSVDSVNMYCHWAFAYWAWLTQWLEMSFLTTWLFLQKQNLLGRTKSWQYQVEFIYSIMKRRYINRWMIFRRNETAYTTLEHNIFHCNRFLAIFFIPYFRQWYKYKLLFLKIKIFLITLAVGNFE